MPPLRPEKASQPSIAGELVALSRRVRLVGCGFRYDPEAIAIQKDDIAADLSRLARLLDRQGAQP